MNFQDNIGHVFDLVGVVIKRGSSYFLGFFAFAFSLCNKQCDCHCLNKLCAVW